ncbi:MAG: OmpA family protein [Bacteroidota bacterium]
MIRSLTPALAVLALLLSGCASTIDRVGNVAERAANRAVDRQIDTRTDRAVTNAIDGMFEAGEDAVRCAFDDDTCIRRAQDQGESVVLINSDGQPVDRNGTPVREDNVEDAVIRSTSLTNVDANYNFQPGERTLYEDDFSSDTVGDFPRSLHYLSGTGEIVDFQGQRFLRFTSSGAFEVRLGQTLPTTFTIQFDAQTGNAGNINVYTAPRVNDRDTRPFSGYEGDYLNVGSWRGSGLWSNGEPKAVVGTPDDEVIRVEITVDDAYVKMYANGERLANVPRADLGRNNAVTFGIGARSDRIIYIGNIRVAAGGNDLYGALQAEGRVVTEGVFFDTASATLKSESFSVIQEIASMMEEHPELRLRVEGHTDNEGDPAANLTLSQRRAAAVTTMLTGLGVAADRLESAGMGQTQPIASNDTAEGRAQNRRVELVSIDGSGQAVRGDTSGSVGDGGN